MKFGGNNVGEARFEVFFPRDATNHPGGQAGSPNWYHYWATLVPGHQLTYGGVGNGPSAEVIAMTGWSYALPQNKTQITLYQKLCGKFRSYGVGEEFSGVDRFIGTVIHEAKHVDQIARADQLVSTGQAGTPWRNGWSFNQGANHNHWTVGPDAKPGVKATDDDGDGTIDNLIASGPGEFGRGDDVDLTHPTTTSRNWPSSWAIPVPLKVPSEIESEAINESDNNHDENKRARDDWGNPGKNHKTLEKWDD